MTRRLFCILLGLLLFYLSFGQSQNAVLSGGMSHTMYLCENGTVFTWGDNTFGQLGRNEEITEDLNPIAIPTLTDIIAISGGKGYFSMAVKKDSSLWTWGQNSQQQLGTDTFCVSPLRCNYSATPVQVKGGETGTHFLKRVLSCSAGLTQSYALLSTGEVVAWGDNYHGQLGNGNTLRQQFPVYVKTSAKSHLTNIKAISAGAMFCLALTNDGKVWAWGKNSEFELACGNNQLQYYATPVLDKNGNQLSNIASISAGYKHAICLTSDGFVYGIGSYKGETWINGITFYTVKSYAEQFSAISKATAISAGFIHNIATITTNGGQTVFAWGDNKTFPITTNNNGGQLGIGDTTVTHIISPQRILTSISEPIDNIQWIAATNSNSFVFRKNGETGSTELYGSGTNEAGQLGTRDHIDRYSAVKIIIPHCNSNCPTAFLGDNKYLCLPIFDTLNSPYDSSHFQYKWFKDGTLLDSENKSSLAISTEGNYTIQITDRIKGCKPIADEISIKQKLANFTIISPPYCGDTVTFKLFNIEHCNWYSKRVYGEYLGHGSIISVPSSALSTNLPDSSKTIWLVSQQCQSMPVTAKKNCSACTILPPIVDYNSTNCLLSTIPVSAIGSNIHWYENGSQSILSLSNTLHVDSTRTAVYSYLVTQSDTICESKPTKISFSVAKCIKSYSLKGSLIPAIKGQITIYDFNTFPTMLDQKTTNDDGSFRFEIPEYSKIIILGKANNASLYEATYFGNTINLEKAHPVLVDANIADANITLQLKVENPFTNQTYSLYPSIVTNFCFISVSHNSPLKIEIYSSFGKCITSFYSNEETSYVNTTTFASGLYFVKIYSETETYQTKTFIKQ